MKPILLHYYVTTRCNARCTFCSIWREGAGQDARLPDVAANCADAAKAGCRFVDFTGGEPLLNKHLPEFLALARKHGLITSVTTNCLLFPERAAELAGLVDLLHFSIDADTPGLHDSMRGKNSYAKVMESIDIALQNRLYPDLLFTYTQENIDAFEGIYRLGRQKKLMVILDPVFSIDDKDPLPPAVHAKAAQYARRGGVYLNNAHLLLRRRGGNTVSKPLCKSVDSTIVILPDNTLALPCYHHRIDFLTTSGGGLAKALRDPVRQKSRDMQGTYQFCDQCHINCYFDPSYGYLKNRLCFASHRSKLKYAVWKYLVYKRPLPKLF